MASDGIICQSCGIEAPTRAVRFQQNIGMVVARQGRTLKANLCKRCLHRRYWQMTGTTVAVGWLGTISCVLAPIYVVANTAQYLAAVGMPAVPPGAKVPVVDQSVVEAVGPQVDEVIDRVNGGEPLLAVARSVAAATGVTPGQVVTYVAAVSKARRAAAAPQPRTGGFPVVPLPAGRPPAPPA